ncbi:MAG: T9SS type A sorting domain-containing protein, partial [Bacteroidia bacterium]|nr:T9SS type A sorting domain-containing protein [Bacteroidia bacterium]
SLCVGIGFYTGASTTEVITIDEIALYGDVVSATPTTLKNRFEMEHLKIYTQKDHLYVQDAEDALVEVYNALGVRIFQSSIKENKKQIKLQSTGFYVVRCTKNGVSLSQKIVLTL